MAADKLTLTFTHLTDANRVWFVNAAAWNAYFEDIEISVASNNLPVATTIAAGTIKQATTSAFVQANYASLDTLILQNITGESVEVPSRNDFDKLIAAYNLLLTDYKALKLSLVSAGIITNA